MERDDKIFADNTIFNVFFDKEYLLPMGAAILIRLKKGEVRMVWTIICHEYTVQYWNNNNRCV